MRILYIEDDPNAARLMEKILMSVGCRMIHMDDIRKGMRELIINKPDLILLDNHLPFINGKDALLMLKGSPSLKRIPVVMVTASDITAAEFIQAGSDGFVAKPVRKAALLDEIQRVTGQVLAAQGS